MCYMIYQIAGKERAKKIDTLFNTKKEIVKSAVLFIQHAYQDYRGDHKYNMAVDYINELFAKAGIETNGYEIKGLVESVLKEFKKEFGEQWKDELY